jgi:hypothetical protein
MEVAIALNQQERHGGVPPLLAAFGETGRLEHLSMECILFRLLQIAHVKIALSHVVHLEYMLSSPSEAIWTGDIYYVPALEALSVLSIYIPV